MKDEVKILNDRALAFCDALGVVEAIQEALRTTSNQHGTMNDRDYTVRILRINSLVANLRQYTEKLKTLQ